jgi:hypothetical protein
MSWEQVHTIYKFWDGPLQGIADFEGQPHMYEREFSKAEDEFTDRYWLSPIEPELMSLVLESSSILHRWWEAFLQDKTTRETYPALPEDRARHETLKQAIGDRFRIDPERSVQRHCQFRYVGEDRKCEVEWSPITD